MKQFVKKALVVLILLSAYAGSLSAQSITFQYGSIPFGQTEENILSRIQNAEVIKQASPTAQFLSSNVIIQEDLSNPVYLFFDGGIRKTVSWGDAYVDLNEQQIKRIDVRPPGEAVSDLYFFNNKLMLLHKSVPMDGRFNDAFANLISPLTQRVGTPTVTGSTRFRGFSYELYAKYAFWGQQKVTLFVLVREKNFQSKSSTIEYVYIDTALWTEYKKTVAAGSVKDNEILGGF